MVLKTPIIRALREKFPDARIDVLCGNSFGTEFVLQSSSWINSIIIFPMNSSLYHQVKFYWKIRKRYDTVFLFFDTAVPYLLCGSVFAGITNRIGHIRNKHSRYSITVASLSERVLLRTNKHEIDCNYDLLDRVFKSQRSYEQYISVPTNYSSMLEKRIQEFCGNNKYLLLQLSAANGTVTPKTWPKAHFQHFIQLMLDRKALLVAVGDRGERGVSEYILKPYGDRVLNLVGETSVPDISLLVKNAHGFVCHDSGLMHIGNAHKTPLIAIFGPSDYVKIWPLSPSSHVVKSDLPCSPCLTFDSPISDREAVKKCPYQIRCMDQITPQMVFEKAVNVFGL